MSDHTAGLSEDTQTERMATMALDMENAARIALREPVGRRNRPVKFRIVLVGGPVLYAVVGRQVLLDSICENELFVSFEFVFSSPASAFLARR